MKKTIAILLVLVIGMVGVWANNSTADLILKTDITGKYGLKIDAAGVSGSNLGEKITSFKDLTEVSEITFDDSEGGLTTILYVNYMSNIKNKAKISTSMLPLTAGLDTEIGYTVVAGTTTVGVEAFEEEPVEIVFLEETALANGMRVSSQEFSITLNSVDWQAAAADTIYTTTWTVNLSVE